MSEKANKIRQQGYYTTTYKKRLYINHIQYLQNTQEIYNDTIQKYYEILLEHLEFLELSNQNCLRELEKLTIKSKTGEKPKEYIDSDTPTYLRRAAINQAIGHVRSYTSKLENYEQGKDIKVNKPQETKKFEDSVTYYKGMYKELTQNSIEIKLFNGEKWKWYKAKLKGRAIPENAEILSPTIIIKEKYIGIHIPIKETIENVTPIKYRMQDNDVRVCGISFSNSDSFAICVILDKERNFIKAKFIKGGKAYKNKTSKITSKIKKHRNENKIKFKKNDHKNYWKKLKNISETTAHKVSKEIVDFCIENKANVISITDMENVGQHFGRRVGKYSPIYLRTKIIEYLKYKAFKQGIIVTHVRGNYTASKCYICRKDIKRNGLKFECPDGHSGDYFFNTAMNIGIMCLKKFGN